MRRKNRKSIKTLLFSSILSLLIPVSMVIAGNWQTIDSEVDQPPRVIQDVSLQYPYLAKLYNINGRVVLNFVVDVDGTARGLEVVSADPPEALEIFQEAALKAVARYKFKPAVKNGEDVRCIVQLPIVFEMDRKISHNSVPQDIDRVS